MREVICKPDQDQCELAPPSENMSSDGLFAASGGTSGLSPEQPSYLIPLSRTAAQHGKAPRKRRSPTKAAGGRKKQVKKKRVGKARLVGGGKKRGKPAKKRKCLKKGKPRKKKSA